MFKNSFLFESREDSIEYQEKLVKGQIDRVTAVLEGRDSEKWTKLAKRYKEIDSQLKLLSVERDEMNSRVKNEFSTLFDAEDEVLTRVISTVSLTATLAKSTPASEKEEINHTAILDELLKLVPDLSEQIKDLTAKHTSIKKVAAKSGALTVKLDEAAGSSVWEKIKGFFADYLKKVKLWGVKYDAKLAELKDRTRRLSEGFSGTTIPFGTKHEAYTNFVKSVPGVVIKKMESLGAKQRDFSCGSSFEKYGEVLAFSDEGFGKSDYWIRDDLNDQLTEKTLTPNEIKKREEIVKKLKGKDLNSDSRVTDADKAIAYAIATDRAKKLTEAFPNPDEVIWKKDHPNGISKVFVIDVGNQGRYFRVIQTGLLGAYGWKSSDHRNEQSAVKRAELALKNKPLGPLTAYGPFVTELKAIQKSDELNEQLRKYPSIRQEFSVKETPDGYLAVVRPVVRESQCQQAEEVLTEDLPTMNRILFHSKLPNDPESELMVTEEENGTYCVIQTGCKGPNRYAYTIHGNRSDAINRAKQVMKGRHLLPSMTSTEELTEEESTDSENEEYQVPRVRSGTIPFYFTPDGTLKMLFMVSSNPNFGGSLPQVSKGGVDSGEEIKQAAIREGEEELGLREYNILRVLSPIKDELFTTFPVEIKDPDHFSDPHFETKQVVWMTPEEFDQKGRPLHKSIVQRVVKLIEKVREIQVSRE